MKTERVAHVSSKCLYKSAHLQTLSEHSACTCSVLAECGDSDLNHYRMAAHVQSKFKVW